MGSETPVWEPKAQTNHAKNEACFREPFIHHLSSLLDHFGLHVGSQKAPKRTQKEAKRPTKRKTKNQKEKRMNNKNGTSSILGWPGGMRRVLERIKGEVKSTPRDMHLGDWIQGLTLWHRSHRIPMPRDLTRQLPLSGAADLIAPRIPPAQFRDSLR